MLRQNANLCGVSCHLCLDSGRVSCLSERSVRSAWDEQRGAEIDKQNSKGFTALTAAARQPRPRVGACCCICLQRDREAALQRVCCECPCVKRAGCVHTCIVQWLTSLRPAYTATRAHRLVASASTAGAGRAATRLSCRPASPLPTRRPRLLCAPPSGRSREPSPHAAAHLPPRRRTA